MTTVASDWSPRQQKLALITDPRDLRDCRIYLIITRDPWAGVAGRLGDPIVGYVGETWRTPAGRLAEHLQEQWWSKDIIGYLVHPTVARNKAEAWQIEKRLVREFETPYNKEYNGSSRWLVIDGRPVHRDDLPAQPGWWPKGVLPTASRTPSAGLSVGRGGKTLGLVVLWLALTAAVWWLNRNAWHGWAGARNSGITATVPYAMWVVYQICREVPPPGQPARRQPARRRPRKRR